MKVKDIIHEHANFIRKEILLSNKKFWINKKTGTALKPLTTFWFHKDFPWFQGQGFEDKELIELYQRIRKWKMLKYKIKCFFRKYFKYHLLPKLLHIIAFNFGTFIVPKITRYFHEGYLWDRRFRGYMKNGKHIREKSLLVWFLDLVDYPKRGW